MLTKAIHSIFLWTAMMLIVVIYGHMIVPLMALFSRNKKAVYYNATIHWSKTLLLLAGIKIDVSGLQNIPPGQPVIFMANHQGHWDYPILISSLKRRFSFIAKKELFAIPFIGNFMMRVGHISIDRQASKSAHETLYKVTQAIKEGGSILIFPEGTRTWDGTVGEFKRGSFRVAFETGVPIIPVAISGSFEIMKRHSWLVNPGKIKLKIGEPIVLMKQGELEKGEYQNAMNRVRDTIISLLPEVKSVNG